MGSQSLMKVPVLDFSGVLKPGTERWKTLTQDVREAVEGLGCFEAVYDTNFPDSLQKEFFSAMKELFDLPLETKMKNQSEVLAHGYWAPKSHAPLYEATSINHAEQLENIEQFTNLMWPQGHPKFK
ncbi:hypothetical protein AMTR_s00181p00019620 [Amborella trichopoda]|uniref:Non-haem dioxygenase N-terminal domain-containing protein n=1 Tax=Amborella trichopoda TaxID=13333 RepID=W1P5Z6_AMBTC|nr:hypothetical protein AMTR_s00181p00019620 [Amborella trichopoda]